MKGYTSGGIILIISIMSIAGKFSLLDTFINLTRKIFHLKAHQSGIGIAFIVALIFLVFGLTYYRPDKILAKHQKISEENEAANIKLLSGCFLFYYAFTLTFAYLIVWLVRK